MQNEAQHNYEPTRRNSARNRKPLVVGFLLSVLIHAVLLLGWRSSGSENPGSLAAGPRTGGFRAAAAGGEMVAIAIAAPRPIIVPAPPANQPRFAEPEVVVNEPEQLIQTPDLSGPVGETTLFSNSGGPGLLNAEGRGDGGNDASGRDRVTPAHPRSIIPVWQPPRELKGMIVTIRVLLNARGEPTGEIVVQPHIPNSGFDRELRRKFLSMDYVPASRNGQAVSDWAEMSLQL